MTLSYTICGKYDHVDFRGCPSYVAEVCLNCSKKYIFTTCDLVRRLSRIFTNIACFYFSLKRCSIDYSLGPEDDSLFQISLHSLVSEMVDLMSLSIL